MKVALPIIRPKEEVKSLENLRVSSHFGKAWGFVIVDTDTLEFKIKENPRFALKIDHGAGKYIAQMFEEENVKKVLVKEIGEGAYAHLKLKGIEVVLLDNSVKTVKEALEKIN